MATDDNTVPVVGESAATTARTIVKPRPTTISVQLKQLAVSHCHRLASRNSNLSTDGGRFRLGVGPDLVTDRIPFRGRCRPSHGVRVYDGDDGDDGDDGPAGPGPGSGPGRAGAPLMTTEQGQLKHGRGTADHLTAPEERRASRQRSQVGHPRIGYAWFVRETSCRAHHIRVCQFRTSAAAGPRRSASRRPPFLRRQSRCPTSVVVIAGDPSPKGRLSFRLSSGPSGLLPACLPLR